MSLRMDAATTTKPLATYGDSPLEAARRAVAASSEAPHLLLASVNRRLRSRNRRCHSWNDSTIQRFNDSTIQRLMNMKTIFPSLHAQGS
jgi:hypothetical protein